MKRFLLIFIVIALLTSTLDARRRKEVLKEQKETKEEKETVVEANHFSSTTEKKKSYDITDLEKDKPILFILKPHNTESTDLTLSKNPITVTLKEGESKTCVFNSYTQLCVLPKVTSDKGTLELECQSTPCEMSWMIIQPATQQDDGDHSTDSLVSVNKQKNHAVLRVYCNNKDLTTQFDESLVLYTNSKYTKVTGHHEIGLAFFLFDNEQQGYYYLTSTNDKVKECANASLQHMNDEISFKSQKNQFRDFLEPLKTNTYEFLSIPDKDFRIEAQAYDIAVNKINNETALKISLNGYKNGKKQVVSTFVLQVDIEKTSIEFNLVFKKPTQKYDKMEMEIIVTSQILMLEARFVAADVQEVELGELSFFRLEKGQSIKYKLVPLAKGVEGIDKIHIFPSSEKIKVSETTCPITGCEFTVEALEKLQGNIYLGEGASKNISQIIVQSFQKSTTAKIGPGQERYFSMNASKNKYFQFLINVPSAIVYGASKAKCPEVTEKCNEFSFNHHFPALYSPKEDGLLLFKVVGLDNCQFTLTVIDEKTSLIELSDSQPFTYLFDDKQKELLFEFKIKEKEDVSFNLIGPVNQLNLYVLNQDKSGNDKKDWTNAELSLDGFIKIDKSDIKGLTFSIKVEKRQQFQKKYVHFTLIASTKESNLRLQTGSAHYETLKPKDTRDYVFQFDPALRTVINFYTHNIHHDVNINMKLSNADQYKNAENTAEFTIDQSVDVLDLGLASKRLCKQNQGQNCQLFIRLQNKMDVQVDITLTLVTDNAIIELKDGIWQNYAVNDVTTSSHFYFLPKHQNHSTTIFYKPSVVDLRIIYSLWKSDDISLNPSQWPFPIDLVKPGKRFQFKPLQYIHIEPAKLKSCWPNCVVLISMITDNEAFQQAVEKNSSVLDARFKIMASNNYIQIPQKHKVDIILAKNESKELLVDLKYSLQKEQISFYTHHTIGNTKIKANVYSQINPRCPTVQDQADFVLDSSQTSIETKKIKDKMSQNSMEDDKNIYLCLLAYAQQSSKFNIQFDSDKNGYKKLNIDTTTNLKTTSKQTLYYIDNSQEIYLKITRDQGFPYYNTKLCKPDEELSKCFDQFAQDEEEGTQLAHKITTLSEKPCPKCVLLIKITTKEMTEIVLHTQSKFTQLELAENSVVSDSLSPNEQNRYTLTGTKDQEIIINIQILSGDLKVGVHDFEKVDLIKNNTKGSKNIHITVPPKDLSPAAKELGSSQMSSFGLSNFVHLHITIQSQDLSKPASYTITYSSGEAIVYLQDGLITQYNLISKKETKFIYKNPSNSPIYLYTSTTDSDALKKLKLEYFALSNLEDEDSSTSITPQKAQFQKKTVNPTHFVMLPAKEAYIFKVNNQNDKNVLFTIGINNREVIYLPFDHEFPIELGPNEYIYLVLNTAVAGSVKITFSKCSISYPYIGYTMDYNDFIKEDYSIENQMNEDLVSDLVLKAKPSSSLYIKVRSPQTDSTLMTVKAIFSTSKLKSGRTKPGDKGQIQYQLLDSTKAELTFASLVCNEEKNCHKDFAYTSISSDNLESVYAQLICPSIMFNVPSIRQLKTATLTPISSIPSSSKITFTQSISNDIQYIGVKAFNSKTGEVVYYQPVQIVTFWGELHRSSGTTMILIAFLLLIFGCGCLMVYRRYKKSQYRPLGELNDAIDRD